MYERELLASPTLVSLPRGVLLPRSIHFKRSAHPFTCLNLYNEIIWPAIFAFRSRALPRVEAGNEQFLESSFSLTKKKMRLSFRTPRPRPPMAYELSPFWPHLDKWRGGYIPDSPLPTVDSLASRNSGPR